MPRPLSKKTSVLLLAGLNALLAAGAELFTRAARLDEKLLAPLLYYQDADAGLHRLSAEPGLHYELRPGAAGNFKEPVRRRVTVNRLGFRGPERAAAKPPGVRRLVFLGSSNTYGALVGDAGTYPAQLERLLNTGGRQRYEVWNAGVCGYVPTQNLAAARRILRDFTPDLLVIQTHNYGRRPFLAGRPFMHFFSEDRHLFRENLRWAWPAPLDWLRYSALARAALAGLNRLAPQSGAARQNKVAELAPRQGEALSRFCAETARLAPVVLLRPPSDGDDGAGGSPPCAADIRLSDSLPPGHGPDFLEIHPGEDVYGWYARTIAGELERAGLLSRR